MITGEDVYLKARELVGTKYIHQGRLKKEGIDCAGVPIWTLRELGLIDINYSNYPRDPDGTMIAKIEEYCQPIDLQPGALIVFKESVYPQHCGIISEYMGDLGLIHAWDVCNKVVEQRLPPEWLSKIVGCYSLPGVNYG